MQEFLIIQTDTEKLGPLDMSIRTAVRKELVWGIWCYLYSFYSCEATKAFRRLAKQHHPDKAWANSCLNSVALPTLSRRMQQVCEANNGIMEC